MNIKLIAIDLDETLLRSDKTYERNRFNEVVEDLVNQGMIIAIVTGNSYHKIEDYFDEKEREMLYFACDNGNHIVRNNEVVGQQVLADHTWRSIIQFLDEFEDYYPIVSNGATAFFRHKDEKMLPIVQKYNNDINLVDSFDELADPVGVSKIAVLSSQGLSRSKQTMRVLNQRYEDAKAVTSGDNWLDIYTKNGGKGSALKWLMDQYNVDAKEVMAFGDSLNDESMMNVAHYSIAMGNADPDLVRACRFQIGSNQDQAVIDVLERLNVTQSTDFLDTKQTR